MYNDVLEHLFGELAGTDVPVPPPARVVARGRQRRRRARAQVLTGMAAAVVLFGLAISEATGLYAPAQSPTGRHHRAAAVCPARPDPALTAELRRALPNTGLSGTTPIALSADGSTAYVLTTADGFHGIAEESVATGIITRKILMLPPNYYIEQGGGLGPHGELVWTQTMIVRDGLETSPVLAWSPKTGIQHPLEPAGQHGHPASAPVFGGPSHELVAWVQDDPQREIVEANLVTGTVDVIATGYVGPPIFVGNSLVWSVEDVPGLPTRLVARNAAKFPARQETGIPAALRGVSPSVLGGEPPPGSPPAWEVSLVASYGGAMAYFAAPGASGALTDLYYSPAPSQPIRLVLRLSGASTFSAGSLALGAGFLGWSLASGTSYVASSASLAAAALTNGTTAFGSVQAAGRFLIAASSPDPTQASRQLSVLSGATIRRLACARALPAGG